MARGRRGGVSVDMADVDRVLDLWRRSSAHPGAIRLTEDRRRLVADRMAEGYTADDLCAMVEWVFLADERGPRWLRGGNPDGVKYLTIEALLRQDKLGPRVQAALEWKDRPAGPAADPVPDNLIALPRGARWRR